jgi:hypothetical protein
MTVGHEYLRQRRLDSIRRCLACNAVLPPYQRGLYCELHGEKRAEPTPVLLSHCRECGRPLRPGRMLCLGCSGGVAG